VLALTTMLWGDEVLSPDRLDEIGEIEEAQATDRELKMAEQLIDSLSAAFEPTKFHDEYREQVLALIEAKANGEEITAPPEVEEPAAAPDLMAALEASLAAVRPGDSDEPAPKPARRRAPTKGEDGDGAPRRSRAKAKS
jgi:DNA end-binding protein Ku